MVMVALACRVRGVGQVIFTRTESTVIPIFFRPSPICPASVV